MFEPAMNVLLDINPNLPNDGHWSPPSPSLSRLSCVSFILPATLELNIDDTFEPQTKKESSGLPGSFCPRAFQRKRNASLNENQIPFKLPLLF